MSKTIRILKFLAVILFIAVVSGCAVSKQNAFNKQRAKSSRISTSQLGRNKYYYSSGYQKKLFKSYKKKD